MAKTTAKAKATEKSTVPAKATAKATAQKAPVVETPEVKDLTVQDVAAAQPEVFKSFCGFDYDPSEASACFTACQKENPEAYAACVVNFKAVADAKGAKGVAKGRRGKNIFGHLIGCQGAKIDDIFTVMKGAHNLEQIMVYADATRPRVISHLKHLVSVWNVDLRITDDGKYFINGHAEGVEGKRHNGVKVIEVPIAEEVPQETAA